MNLEEELIVLLKKETSAKKRIDALMNGLAIEMAYSCTVSPDEEEALQMLRKVYLAKIKKIEELAKEVSDVHD